MGRMHLEARNRTQWVAGGAWMIEVEAAVRTEMVPVCIQDPNATVSLRHARGCASSTLAGSDH